ncbi:SDR family NAD(P)-dependent oxidoreductase [Edaphosphingomonas haloaromaticamans]|uniref:3-oxoacyl-[acyl-carrier-protein] reductase FabG n=1 Tax=Edaphosphingomonas haloaromaticamans TaxID=653954 RepID=A0A1S1HIU7_9SPHN|nr:SDR family oxidoreductase [Sphingomonas haloaromaticamans]OHT21143.1 3-oxoacyl-[acyl-carrier-protein] reductase FabG [Sphingomonas haloaromaticamans]
MAAVSFDFSCRRVLVTGATSGIGAAIARAFADAGAEVIATGTRPSAGDYADPPPGEYRRFLLGDAASTDALIASIDRLDILVNNAGATGHPEDFAAAVQTNLTGVHRLTTGLAPLLEASDMPGGGAVVSIASMMAVFGNSIFPGYSAAKAGLLLLTKSLAQGWGGRIRINAVAPGPVRTPMTERYADDPAYGPATAARMALGRWGDPQDIAGPVLFLASPAAAFITGECLIASGGYMIAEA